MNDNKYLKVMRKDCGTVIINHTVLYRCGCQRLFETERIRIIHTKCAQHKEGIDEMRATIFYKMK